jgi:hypothetical protein
MRQEERLLIHKRMISLRFLAACALFLPCIPATAAPVEVRRAVPVSQAEDSRTDINDLSRFIAGIPPPAGSPLASLAARAEWIDFAATMNERWRAFDAARLQPIRSWRTTAMEGINPATLFYPFSGPDFIYAETFFPGANSYILCGLEPVGDPPSMEKIQPLSQTLGWLQSSFKTLLEAGYFVTKDMRVDFKMSPLQGTLPVLCVMLARSGNRIVSLTRDSDHAEIHFVRAESGQPATLYYYCVNLRDEGLGKAGASFLNFVKQSRPGAAYIKAASYLMHESDFSTIRNLLLTQCPVIVQDDSGIPLRYFDVAHWDLRPFGKYAPPLDIFKQYYQADMTDLYRKTTAAPLGFGTGYHWDLRTANLIIFTRK